MHQKLAIVWMLSINGLDFVCVYVCMCVLPSKLEVEINKGMKHLALLYLSKASRISVVSVPKDRPHNEKISFYEQGIAGGND